MKNNTKHGRPVGSVVLGRRFADDELKSIEMGEILECECNPTTQRIVLSQQEIYEQLFANC